MSFVFNKHFQPVLHIMGDKKYKIAYIYQALSMLIIYITSFGSCQNSAKIDFALSIV